MVYAKSAESIDMLLGEQNHVVSRKHVLDGGQGRMNPFTAMRSDKLAMRPFVFDHLFVELLQAESLQG